MTTKRPKPIFFESIFSVLTILSFGIYLLSRGIKDKKDFTHITGKIVFYSDMYESFPHDKTNKFKYLQIDSYPEVFEIHIPFADDVKNLFDYNKLDTGDTIEIYFDKDKFAAEKRVNMTAMYIDKKSVPILISVRNDRVAGISFIGVGTLILIGLCTLKYKGKIE